jgi:hypothetical protein
MGVTRPVVETESGDGELKSGGETDGPFTAASLLSRKISA